MVNWINDDREWDALRPLPPLRKMGNFFHVTLPVYLGRYTKKNLIHGRYNVTGRKYPAH